MFGEKKSLKDSERSLISETVSIDGTVNSSGAIDVAGLVKGPVYSKELIIRDTGSITGSIEADDVEIHGHLDGKVTAQNIVIGGAAGAFPPIIGHICATGSIGVEALILFLIIFLWTPPHFWALALINKSDYRAAKIPMLPIIYGDMATRKNIFIYSLLLMPCAYLPWILNYSGNFYLIVVTLPVSYTHLTLPTILLV